MPARRSVQSRFRAGPFGRLGRRRCRPSRRSGAPRPRGTSAHATPRRRADAPGRVGRRVDESLSGSVRSSARATLIRPSAPVARSRGSSSGWTSWIDGRYSVGVQTWRFRGDLGRSIRRPRRPHRPPLARIPTMGWELTGRPWRRRLRGTPRSVIRVSRGTMATASLDVHGSAALVPLAPCRWGLAVTE